MSVKVMSHVWTHSKQKSSKLLTLLAIADSANDDGFAWLSQETLAKKVRMTKRNAQRILDDLEKRSEVVIYNRVSEEEAEQHFTNVYQIPLPGNRALPGELKGVFRKRGAVGNDGAVAGGSDAAVATGNDTPVTTVATSPSPGVVTPTPPNPSLNPSIYPSDIDPTTPGVVVETELPDGDEASTTNPDAARIFTLYQENCGTLTSLIVDQIKDALKTFPADWIEDAIKIAVSREKRFWNYIQGILDNWRTDGRGSLPPNKTKSAAADANGHAARLEALIEEELAAQPDEPPAHYLPNQPQEARQRDWRMAGRRGAAKQRAEARIAKEEAHV